LSDNKEGLLFVVAPEYNTTCKVAKNIVEVRRAQGVGGRQINVEVLTKPFVIGIKEEGCST
jgi:hypothetical protein